MDLKRELNDGGCVTRVALLAFALWLLYWTLAN